MQTSDPLALTRMHLANAEAQARALRGAHRRPVHRATCDDDLIRIDGLPEMQGWYPEMEPMARRLRTSCAACWTARLLLAGFVLFWIVVIAGALWSALPDRTAVIDLIAPTAAQARETGWVAIMEGL